MPGDATADPRQIIAELRSRLDGCMAELAQRTAERDEALDQQKMAALGQLTAGIAHEIKNPLNFINNFAGLSVELLNELKAAAAPATAALDDGARAQDQSFNITLERDLDRSLEPIAVVPQDVTRHVRPRLFRTISAHGRIFSGASPQTFEIIGVPYRIRTGVAAVRGRCPGPLDEGDADAAA